MELFERRETQEFLLNALEGSCEAVQLTALSILQAYFEAEEKLILSLDVIEHGVRDMLTTPKEASHDE